MDVDWVEVVPKDLFRDILLRSSEPRLVMRWGLVVFANPACARLLGVGDGSDLLGHALIELLDVPYRKRVGAHLQAILEGAAETVVVTATVCNQRGESEVEIAFSVLDTACETVLATLRDLGEQRRAEAAARVTGQMYRAMFHSAADGYLMVDTRGRVLDVNEVYLRRSGYSRNEVLRLTVNDLDAEEPSDETAARLQQIIADGAAIFECRHRARSGEVWPAEARVVYLSEMNGGCFITLVRDISERQRTLQALSDSADQLRLVTHLLPALLCYVDAHCRYQWVNARHAEWHGRAVDDTVGHAMRELLGEEIWALARPYVDRVLAGELVSFEGHQRSHPVHGSCWLDITYAPDFDEGGRVKGFVIMAQDVTEARRAQEAQDRVDKLQALGTLAGGIAHDFNNILLAINGNTELAKREMEEGRLPVECIDEIGLGGRRAADLVRRILTFSRPAQAEQSASLPEVVREAVILLRATLPKMVTLEVDCSATVPHVSVDPSQMVQVLLNLGTNAAHAIGRQAGTIRFAVDVVPAPKYVAGSAEGTHVRLTVADTGCGMPPEVIARMYDPFYTTKPVGEGTGLGLSMVHSIITRHRGAIHVQSELRKGTTFHLMLPACAAVPASRPAAAHVPRGGTSRLLYVDDEVHLVSLVKRALTRLGYLVTACTDAGEALGLYQASPDAYDVVVTDLSMPAMSGFELARSVLAARPSARVLLMSGYVAESDEATALQIGIERVLLKQDSLDQLVETLQSVVSGGARV